MSDWYEKQTQELDYSEFKMTVHDKSLIFVLPEEVKVFSKKLFLGDLYIFPE